MPAEPRNLPYSALTQLVMTYIYLKYAVCTRPLTNAGHAHKEEHVCNARAALHVVEAPSSRRKPRTLYSASGTARRHAVYALHSASGPSCTPEHAQTSSLYAPTHAGTRAAV